MSQENVETLNEVYEEWARGNFRAGEGLFDRLVVCVVSPGSPEPGVYLGMDEVNKWMRQQLEAWETLTIQAEEFIDAGDTVVVAVHRRGVGRRAGASVEDRHFHLWTFRGRTVVRYEIVPARAEALEAAGLSG